jgi:glutamyl-tRNA reductase
MDNVFVYDVDDLQQVAEENLAVRAREAARAERIIEEEVESFLKWRRSLELAPTIVALRKQFSDVADEEVRRALGRLQDLSQSDRTAFEAMTRSLVNKLLHRPMMQLKAGAGEPDGVQLIDAVRRLFALTDHDDAEEKTSIQADAEANVTQLTAAAAPGRTGESK